MKRDPRLRPLSRDHHHALVLARFIQAICARGLDGEAIALVKERFTAEIVPHFDIEESLLAALEGRGVDDLVARTRDEHATMLRLLGVAVPHDVSAIHELGELIVAHVRFEERELYPAFEEHLPPAVLDAVARAHAGRQEE